MHRLTSLNHLASEVRVVRTDVGLSVCYFDSSKAKEIVLRHKELQAKAATLEREVVHLEEQQEELLARQVPKANGFVEVGRPALSERPSD